MISYHVRHANEIKGSFNIGLFSNLFDSNSYLLTSILSYDKAGMRTLLSHLSFKFVKCQPNVNFFHSMFSYCNQIRPMHVPDISLHINFVFVQSISINVYSNSSAGMDKALYWSTNLNETFTKMNAKRQNGFRCNVSNDCAWRIWIVIDDNLISTLSIQCFHIVIKFVPRTCTWHFAAHQFRLCAINFNQCSFKFVGWHGQGIYWSTNLNETLTKMNAKRQNGFRCNVSNDCAWRIWIVIDDNLISTLSIQCFHIVIKFVPRTSTWHFTAHQFRLCAINFNQCSFKFVGWLGQGIYTGRRIWMKLWRKWMQKDRIAVVVMCPTTVPDEFEV